MKLIHPAYHAMLGHLHGKALLSFKMGLEESLKRGEEFSACVHDCTESSFQFDLECQGNICSLLCYAYCKLNAFTVTMSWAYEFQ